MSNRQSLGQALKCFANPRKRQAYFHLYSEDIVLHGYQGVEPGLESVKQFYNGFWEIFPDAQVTIQELIEVEEDDTLVVRYVITGTQQKEFMGIAAIGQRIELPGISILHFRNGRCFGRWTCSDSLLLFDQVGGQVTPYILTKSHSTSRAGSTPRRCSFDLSRALLESQCVTNAWRV